MNPYPTGYPPQPRELIRATCVQGTLVVTDHLIQVGRLGRQQSLARASLVGIDYRLTLLFPFLRRANLTFHGTGGERLHVTSLPAGKAKEIKQLLGY